ncbi:MAG: 1-deoxy-D-xylulose-5-phosphate synthase [Pelotomaculum sp. PtaB.Bin104]|nr:MAG: 1-deoxy-D-xylulose-5-phosphate synthase [Pelotomaculum sp. PtaB.Bin104]
MSNILKNIRSPRDIRSLNISQMHDLAAEIRRIIIETVAKNGGHLAPNLGVVELTLALHRVFNSPADKIIWDVGHQSYVHKLLTGRFDEFETLRQFGGLSGFPRPSENVHDAFGTGHSSTSISAALGLAVARDLKGGSYSVIAVIGDGAMTGGMSYEALNHAGHLKKDLIVILNDNEMSIAQNVGAMSGYLNRLRTDPMYSKGKEEIEQLLRKMPIGPTLLRLGERLKDSLKYLVVPGMIFEELGFFYLGPVDGHDLKAIDTVLQRARAIKGPVLVHVVTKKGKGYQPAEDNPDQFHGIGPFNVDSGQVIKNSSAPSYTEVFGNTIVRLAAKNSKLLAITAAMPGGTGLTKFAKNFPERFFDVGIAEQHGVTLAAGLSAGGYHPVVAIYSTFLQRAYDQILHDICLQNLPVTFAIDRAGIVGDDGPTHHGLFDYSFLRPIPNMIVMAPKDENELQHMLATAVDHSGPSAVRYPRGAGLGVKIDDYQKILPIGQAEVLREGSDLTLLAVGSMVSRAEEAANLLAKWGIKATVINARFIKPLDEECILKYADRTRKVFTLEEHVLQGGFGSAVLELLSTRGVNRVEVYRFGIPDNFVEHGKHSLIMEKHGLSVNQLVRKITEMCGSKGRLRKLKAVSD